MRNVKQATPNYSAAALAVCVGAIKVDPYSLTFLAPRWPLALGQVYPASVLLSWARLAAFSPRLLAHISPWLFPVTFDLSLVAGCGILGPEPKPFLGKFLGFLSDSRTVVL